MSRKLMSLLVVCLLAVAPAGAGFVQSAAATGYTFTDRTTGLKLELGSYDRAYVQGEHMVWSSNRRHIHYANLATQETKQITDYESEKRDPVVAVTEQGVHIAWADDVNYREAPGHGFDIFGYDLATGARKQLSGGKELLQLKLEAEGDHIVWSIEGAPYPTLMHYRLSTGEERSLGYGIDPRLHNDMLVYDNYMGAILLRDLSTDETTELKRARSFDTFVLSEDGQHLLGVDEISNIVHYDILHMDRPDQPTVRVREASRGRYLLAAGATYGLIAEGDEELATVTGVDFLHEETFEIDLNVGIRDILSFSNENIVYLNEANQVAVRSIHAPLDRSDRDGRPIKVLADGKEIAFRAPPALVEGTTMVEFRPIFEALGFAIEWDEASRTVIGRRGSKELRLQLGSTEAVVDGERIAVSVAPTLMHDATYVPLRLVGEGADRRVTWDAESYTVYISPKDTDDTLYYLNGRVMYRGDLVDGKREGYGVLYREENDRVAYEGEWRNDLKHGSGKSYYSFSDDLFFVGTFVNGKQSEGTEYYPGGMLRYQGTYGDTGYYDDGVRTIYHTSTGRYIISEVVDGRMHGKAEEYYADGTLQFEGTYENGVKAYGKLYDEDGNVIYEGAFEDGRPIAE